MSSDTSRKFPGRFMCRLVLCALSGLLVTPATAAEAGAGSLTITIRPEAMVLTPASVNAYGAITGSEWSLRFDLPVSVKVRVSRTASAELRMEPAIDPAQAITGYQGAEISVTGVQGAATVDFPVRVILDRSGVYQMTAAITLRGSGPLAPGGLPLHLTLKSQDGAIDWSGAVRLGWGHIEQSLLIGR